MFVWEGRGGEGKGGSLDSLLFPWVHVWFPVRCMSKQKRFRTEKEKVWASVQGKHYDIAGEE